MSAEEMVYIPCPRCDGVIENHGGVVMAGTSRATSDRDIEICGPCCSDEALREALEDWVVPCRSGRWSTTARSGSVLLKRTSTTVHSWRSSSLLRESSSDRPLPAGDAGAGSRVGCDQGQRGQVRALPQVRCAARLGAPIAHRFVRCSPFPVQRVRESGRVAPEGSRQRVANGRRGREGRTELACSCHRSVRCPSHCQKSRQ